MTPQKVKCKLTAILRADVNGYSRLMERMRKGPVQSRVTMRA